jgi:hypothetical protein
MLEVYSNILRDHFGLSPVGRSDFDWNAVLRESYPTIHRHVLTFAEENKPYQAPASMENTVEGHLANWNSFGPAIWLEVLKVHANPKRIPLATPFRNGDWIYASPGNHAVKLPLSFAPDAEVNPESPKKMEGFFGHVAAPGDWHKFTDLGVLPAIEKVECESCRGHGYNTLKVGNRLLPGEICTSCEGEGETNIHPKVKLEVLKPLRTQDERFMSARTVSILSLLPDAQWKPSEDLKFCVGTFAGGQGQFIGVLSPDKD